MNKYESPRDLKKKHRDIERPLTFTEACNFLQISKSTLYKLTWKKKIKFYKPGKGVGCGGKLYFKKSDLLKWVYGKPPAINGRKSNDDE